MLLLGIDLGTSSVKVSVVDADSQQCLCTVQYPDNEAEIISVHPGWAEQSPDQWWEHVTQAVLKCHATGDYDPRSIAAIGIAYQMHGLVLIDRELQVIRNSIIWCDSRAVEIGDHAYHEIGEQACLSRLLNSPGNFTASKLAWVKENEPAIYNKIYKAMLPGDFISLKFSGVVTTTSSALSEGILWDYQREQVSQQIIEYFGFDPGLFPSVHPLFSEQALPEDLDVLREKLQSTRPVAVGEIGLDFFVEGLEREKQENYFSQQLKLAQEFDLPVLLHVRRSVDQVLKHLRRIPVRAGIAHAFNGSRQQADIFIKLGFKLGFGGAMTWPRALHLQELAMTLPLESIVLETDAPDAPAGQGGLYPFRIDLPQFPGRGRFS